MLFKTELCEAILGGRKTQTRRLVQPNESLYRYATGIWGQGVVGVEYCNAHGWWRIKWEVGRTYAIQPGRGKKAVGRFLLTGIRRERLQDITGEDAIAEGCDPVQHTALGITLTPALQTAGDIALLMFRQLWDEINTKKATRWRDNPEVWVLEFEAVKE